METSLGTAFLVADVTTILLLFAAEQPAHNFVVKLSCKLCGERIAQR